MALPPLVPYSTQAEYRTHFEKFYCRGPITTFDGIQVRFRKKQFDHCFFESVDTKDDTFSPQRAERIDWIKAVLQDPSAELRVGWDNKKKKPSKNRRVAIVVNSYVVIVRIYGNGTRAEFVTAFAAGQSTIRQIRSNPLWE